jgi:hypothetical protein
LNLILLTFDLNNIVMKFMGIVSIFFSIYLLISQKEIEKVKDYRTTADDYKSLYDRLELANAKREFEIEPFLERFDTLQKQNQSCNVTWLAHKWTDRVIRKEMNIDWIYKN